MADFLNTALGFPTVVWSFFFALCTLYWLLAVFGLVDNDFLDDLFGNTSADDAHASASILSRLGLDGIPIMLVLTLLAFTGWISCYFIHLLVLSPLTGPFNTGMVRSLGNIATLFGSLIPGVLLTSLFLRPFRTFFLKLSSPQSRSLIGSAGTVTTPYVDRDYGTASVEDGGAGLILQIRSPSSEKLKRGDRIILLEYDAQDNSYLVTSEALLKS